MVSSRTTRGHLIFVKSREIRHDSMITIHKPNIGIVFEAKFRQKDPGQSRASNNSTNTQGSGFCEFEGDQVTVTYRFTRADFEPFLYNWILSKREKTVETTDCSLI